MYVAQGEYMCTCQLYVYTCVLASGHTITRAYTGRHMYPGLFPAWAGLLIINMVFVSTHTK